MPAQLICSQGHHWSSGNLQGFAGEVCPHCGGTAEKCLSDEALDQQPTLAGPPHCQPGAMPATLPYTATNPLTASTLAPDKLPACSGPDWPQVANYEIVGLLGRGGMGVVY